uniref:Uncharacterized protein n=1 Tax=Bos indicus x Bos taurus TaxID=30522 RepID=A0A4W2CEP9_BOBOX
MINLLLQLSKLASNVSCVTIQHRCISSTDLARMVQNNHLSCEASSFHGWIIFAVTSHIAMTDIIDRHVLDIEAHIVPRKGFTQCFMQGGSTGIAVLTGDFPSLEPWHISTWLQRVVTIPARNWHKCYCVGVVADFLNVGADFLNNFLVSLLAIGWLSGIHFVNANN